MSERSTAESQSSTTGTKGPVADASKVASGWQPPALFKAAPAVTSDAPSGPAEPVVESPPDPLAEAARAREEGYAAGLAEGLAEGRARGEVMVGDLQLLLEALETPFAESDAALTRELLDLTERVARAVLKRELQTDSSAIEAVVTEAMAVLADGSARVELSLNPQDAALCRELGMSIRGNVVLTENPQMHRGGVELRSGSRLVDASIDTRLQGVLETLYADAGLPLPAHRPSKTTEAN